MAKRTSIITVLTHDFDAQLTESTQLCTILNIIISTESNRVPAQVTVYQDYLTCYVLLEEQKQERVQIFELKRAIALTNYLESESLGCVSYRRRSRDSDSWKATYVFKDIAESDLCERAIPEFLHQCAQNQNLGRVLLSNIRTGTDEPNQQEMRTFLRELGLTSPDVRYREAHVFGVCTSDHYLPQVTLSVMSLTPIEASVSLVSPLWNIPLGYNETKLSAVLHNLSDKLSNGTYTLQDYPRNPVIQYQFTVTRENTNTEAVFNQALQDYSIVLNHLVTLHKLSEKFISEDIPTADIDILHQDRDILMFWSTTCGELIHFNPRNVELLQVSIRTDVWLPNFIFNWEIPAALDLHLRLLMCIYKMKQFDPDLHSALRDRQFPMNPVQVLELLRPTYRIDWSGMGRTALLDSIDPAETLGAEWESRHVKIEQVFDREEAAERQVEGLIKAVLTVMFPQTHIKNFFFPGFIATDDCLKIVDERLATLDQLLTQQTLSEKEIHQLLASIIRALKTRHDNGLYHLQLTLKKVCREELTHGDVKLTGAVHFPYFLPSLSSVDNSDLRFFAPEVQLCMQSETVEVKQTLSKSITEKADVYSLGVIADVLLDHGPADLRSRDLHFVSWVTKCVQADPAQRPCLL